MARSEPEDLVESLRVRVLELEYERNSARGLYQNERLLRERTETRVKEIEEQRLELAKVDTEKLHRSAQRADAAEARVKDLVALAIEQDGKAARLAGDVARLKAENEALRQDAGHWRSHARSLEARVAELEESIRLGIDGGLVARVATLEAALRKAAHRLELLARADRDFLSWVQDARSALNGSGKGGGQ